MRLYTSVGLDLIEQERRRQLRLKSEGRFDYTPSDAELTDGQCLAMIVEEVGEVGRNVLARDGLVSDGDTTDIALLDELSQVAALSLAWIERLYSRVYRDEIERLPPRVYRGE